MDTKIEGIGVREFPLPKFCRDCANVSIPYSGEPAKYSCFAPQHSAGYDLVTGNKLFAPAACYNARVSLDSRHCGEVGRWFIPAPPKPLPAVTPAQLPTPTKAASGMDLSSGVDDAALEASKIAAREKLAAALKAKAGGVKPVIKSAGLEDLGL